MESLEQMLSPMIYSDRRVIMQSPSQNELSLMENIRKYKINLLTKSASYEKLNYIRPEILESWQRSYRYGLNIFDYNFAPRLSHAELTELNQEKDILLKAADPYICELESMLLNTNSIILLTDEQGVMLRVIDGDTGLLAEQNQRFHLGLGSIWSERTVGTCGHTLSLELGIPIQICGPEHYCEKHEQIACSSAPIFDIDQVLSGTLSIVTPSYHDQNSHTLALVRNMARAIQHEFQYQLTSHMLKATIEDSEDAVLTINRRGVIVKANTIAMDSLCHSSQEIIGAKIDSVLGNHPLIESSMKTGKAINDVNLELKLAKYKMAFMSIKPITNDYGKCLGCVLVLRRVNHQRKTKNPVKVTKPKSAFDGIIGSSHELKETIRLAKKFADLDDPVLIQGESGTGKEVFAQAIHAQGRPNGPMIAVNCAAIPKTLIESELFGYKGGAFTGAERNGRPGKIELADGGTLFLDEIGDMPLELQPVLLRVLEEKQVMRVGDNEPIPVNFRLIAATNKNLEQLVKDNLFREDLYYRIAVFTLKIPPLRDRKSDINDLLNYFITDIAHNQKMQPPVLSSATKCLLYQYDWPGNVRQLKNTIKYAMTMSKNGQIKLEDLPEAILKESSHFLNTEEATEQFDNQALKESPKLLNEMEKEVIQSALINKGYNISQTAKSLGLSRSTLYRKMKEYGLLIGGENAQK